MTKQLKSLEKSKHQTDFVLVEKSELKTLISEAVVEALSEHPASSHSLKREMISQEALAEYLGRSIGTLISWRKQGFITAIKIGKSVFYDREKVLDEIAQLKTLG
jgi:hypothetical protein